MIPLFKTHYSIGKGIIQVEPKYKPKKEGDIRPEFHPLNLVDLCLKYEIKQCFVVDDSMGGIWPAFNTLSEEGIALVFGLRVTFVNDATDKTDESMTSGHKNIIFVKNEAGYKQLIKIASKANTEFFYNESRLDYAYLHSAFTDDLSLAVPFYDSFLMQNYMNNRQCIPEFRNIKPVYFLEDNNLPFDQVMRRLVKKCAKDYEQVDTKTIYYENKKDSVALMARRLMVRGGHKAATIDKPELQHFASDEFCLEAWKEKMNE